VGTTELSACGGPPAGRPGQETRSCPTGLEMVSFREARLVQTDLRRVELRIVRGLTREQIAEAITDETTLLPDYLKEEGEEGSEVGSGAGWCGWAAACAFPPAERGCGRGVWEGSRSGAWLAPRGGWSVP